MTARAKRHRQLPLGLLSLTAIVATVVLTLAYPRLVSSVTYIPVDAALDRHWQDYPIRQSQFPMLIGIAKKSLERLDHSRYWQGLAWLYYLQADEAGLETEEGKSALQQSQTAFEKALAKSPANPASWLRLAWIHELLGHASSDVISALKMSFYTGRAERYLMLNRLDLALQYANDFEPQDISLVRDQIQLTWRFYEPDMVKLIESGTFNKYIIFGLISDTHPLLATEIQDKI